MVLDVPPTMKQTRDMRRSLSLRRAMVSVGLAS